jgi:hypothetical protein
MGVACVLLLGLTGAWAQMGSQPLGSSPLGGGPGRAAERIEQWKKIRLIEMLDLKEDVSVRFFSRMNEHEKRKRDLMKERGDVLDRLERLIRVGSPAAEFEKAFGEMADIDGRIAAADRAFFDGLSDILVIEQRAKMVLFERRFEGELREAMKEQFRRRRSPAVE